MSLDAKTLAEEKKKLFFKLSANELGHELGSENVKKLIEDFCDFDSHEGIPIEYFQTPRRERTDVVTTQLIIMHDAGKHGGKSLKVTNLIINWKKVLASFGKLGVQGAVYEATTKSELQLIAALLWLLIDTYQASSIEISKELAPILFAISQKMSPDRTISYVDAYNETNHLLKTFQRSPITTITFDEHLDSLKKIRCLQLKNPGLIKLEESVKAKIKP